MKVSKNIDFDEWKEIADKCSYSTFFHTPAWSKIFVQTHPNMKITTKKYTFDDKTRVILPMINKKTRKGLLGSYFSNIADVYGGIISEKKISNNKINDIFLSLISRNIASISIMGNPLLNYVLPGQFRERIDFTHLLKLDKGKEKIWANYKSSVRSQINKAESLGVICKEADNNINEWKKYYYIYENELERWRDKVTSHYHFSLFENISKAKNPNIKLWFVIFCERVVGGSLVFYHNKHCVSWHSSFLSDYFKYGICNFLYHNIILDAFQKGYEYFDFNPSGGHKGVSKFKETFGTEKLEIKIWKWENPLIRKMASKKE